MGKLIARSLFIPSFFLVVFSLSGCGNGNAGTQNQTPVAQSISLSTNENASKSIVLLGTDSDGTIASYAIVSSPSHGSLSGTAPNLTYTPAANYIGSDSFTFTVTDNGGATSTAATVSITVNAVNSPPTATAQSISLGHDTSTTIILSGTDSDGTISSYTVTNGPTNGSLSGSAPNLTYTPTAAYSGSDSFTFTVTDNSGATSAAATVSITVLSNDPPTATAQNVTTDEDTAKAITLAGTDSDGTIASYAIVSGPGNGSLSGTAPNLTYTPNANYNGSDSFSFTVTDNGGATSTAATVSITVNPVNDPPVANTDSYNDTGNTQESINAASGVLTNDTDIDTPKANLTVTTTGAITTTMGGTVNMNSDGSFTYTPAAGYTGSDSFSYTISDNDPTNPKTATGTVNITVKNLVWYVDDSAPAGGDGRSSAPYNTLAAGVVALSSGETLFLYAGSYTGGITLPVGSSLIGEGSGLTVTGLTIPAGTKPSISALSGAEGTGINVITLTNGDTIKGVTITAGAYGIYGNAITDVTMSNISVTNTGDSSIYLKDCIGTISLQNSTISNVFSTVSGNYGLFVGDTPGSTATGTVSVNVNNTSFTGNIAGQGLENGIDVYSEVGHVQVTSITANQFTNIPGAFAVATNVWGIAANTGGGDTVTIGNNAGSTGNGNTFTGITGVPIKLLATDNTNTSFTVRGNTIDGNGNSTDRGIQYQIYPNGALSKVDISNNSISQVGNDTLLQAYPNEYTDLYGIGVFVYAAASGSNYSTADVTINGNTLSNIGGRGIHVDNYGNATFGVTMNNNTVTGSTSNQGLNVYSDNGALTCVAASGNSTAGADQIILYNGGVAANSVTPSININGAASSAAVSANNYSMTVSPTGTISYGTGCNLTP